jgi:hypothetical protein
VQLLHFTAALAFMDSSPRLLDPHGIFVVEITSENISLASANWCADVPGSVLAFAAIVTRSVTQLLTRFQVSRRPVFDT